jgi:hypothetical protein
VTTTESNQPTPAGDNAPARVEPATLDVLDSEVFQRFLAASETDAQELDPEHVSIAIIGRILNATSVDDVLGGAGATHARDFLGVPFVLTGVRFNQSDFGEGGPSFYALLEGANGDGEPVTVTCGARNVIAQAWKLRDMGALPVKLVLQESDRPTRAGYKVMWLEKAPASF